MTADTLPPDPTEAEKTKSPIDNAANFLDEWSFKLLLVPFGVFLIYAFFLQNHPAIVSLTCIIYWPIIGLLALATQFYKMAKKQPSNPKRIYIILLSILSLMVTFIFWAFAIVQNGN